MRIALLTIGQSSRKDLSSDLEKYLKNIDYEIIGILDKYSVDEILDKFSPKPNEEYYVTLLRNNLWIKVSVEKITRETQLVISKIEELFDIIVFLCTGYAELNSRKILVHPDILIKNIVLSLNIRRVGIVTPTLEQFDIVMNKWKNTSLETIITFFNPYSEELDVLNKRVSILKNCDLIILDCIGYSDLHRDIVKKVVNKPIILPRTLLLSFIRELVGV